MSLFTCWCDLHTLYIEVKMTICASSVSPISRKMSWNLVTSNKVTVFSITAAHSLSQFRITLYFPVTKVQIYTLKLWINQTFVLLLKCTFPRPVQNSNVLLLRHTLFTWSSNIIIKDDNCQPHAIIVPSHLEMSSVKTF